ncbi:pentatricopeptide repeat-containing protein [Tripterygium wilfordii]|uniref:Pentatricopeptide repeat-containing protein n=1 Tax=Tripterygium wilfordii TaxID=458696 RepID=A0A7J7CU63_TRIWF|nr:pentatricopeptide repeat-containing protein [Tripterygium wilfordii]
MEDTLPQLCVHHETSINSNSQTPTLESPISISLDPLLYISALLKCNNVLQIREVHGQVTASGMLHNLDVANKLLYIYAQHKLLTDAYALFGDMKERDAVTWSVIVGGFAKIGDYSNCFGTFRELIRFGIPRPGNYILPSVIRACRESVDLVMGKSVHDLVVKSGLDLDHFVCAALVDMYAKCRVIEDARKLFDEMPKKDLVTWTVMIGAFADCGNANESMALFDRMTDVGVVPDKIAMEPR